MPGNNKQRHCFWQLLLLLVTVGVAGDVMQLLLVIAGVAGGVMQLLLVIAGVAGRLMAVEAAFIGHT